MAVSGKTGPAHERETSRRHDVASGTPQGSPPPPTVLIVDDEAHLRLLYEIEFKRCGFATLSAADGLRCLDNLMAMTIDLIVLDIRMPGMDGIDLLARIRGMDRSIPVIINTAYSGYADNYLTWSANAFLVKSSDPSELIKKACGLLSSSAKIVSGSPPAPRANAAPTTLSSRADAGSGTASTLARSRECAG
jgi:CheY-like chemotaxis protein